MIQLVNSLIGKPYDAKQFNCFTLVCLFHPSLNIPEEVIHSGVKRSIAETRRLLALFTRQYEYVTSPSDNDIVLSNDTHVGIFVGGRVLHTSPPTNTILESLDTYLMTHSRTKYLRIIK